MRKSSIGRRSSTNPVRISMFDREDKNISRTDSRRTQTLKSKPSISSIEVSHIPRPHFRSSSCEQINRRSNLKLGKTPLSQHAPTTPVTPGNLIRLPTGQRSLSADRASNIGAKGPRKDTRLLIDKTYQMQMLNKIDTYFHQIQCSSMLNSNGSLKPITLKMFVEVSSFLVKYIDGKQTFNTANYVEEIPKIAKKLCYPGVVTKSWLKIANAMHSWPNVLGWLCWLVEICQVKDIARTIYRLDNLPFIGSEKQIRYNQNFFFSMLSMYAAWNDEKLEEEEALVAKYLREIEDQQGVTDADIVKAQLELEAATAHLHVTEEKSRKIEEEVKHLKEIFQTIQADEVSQATDIRAKEDYIKNVNIETKRLSAENEILCQQIQLKDMKKKELIAVIKEQPMSKEEKDAVLNKCGEIQNYILQFDVYLNDVQKEIYTLDIKTASVINNLHKKILEYNKEIFICLGSNAIINIEELKMPEKNILSSNMAENLNEKANSMNDLKNKLRKQFLEKECIAKSLTNELEINQEKLKTLKEDNQISINKLKERQAHMSKIKADAKNEEFKLREQIKILQDEIHQDQESLPNLQRIMSEVEEIKAKLDTVSRRKIFFEQNAKQFFSKFFEMLGEHRNKLHSILGKLQHDSK